MRSHRPRATQPPRSHRARADLTLAAYLLLVALVVLVAGTVAVGDLWPAPSPARPVVSRETVTVTYPWDGLPPGVRRWARP